MTETVLIVFAIIFLIVGFLGTFLPVIPGVPLAWGGLLLAFFTERCAIPFWLLILTGVAAACVVVLDSFLPVLLTKKQQGSKFGTWGATIGMVIGFFAGPLGIILGPFFGALIGELIHDHEDFNRAFKVAWGAFLGFLFGTGLKMLAVAAFIWIFIKFCFY